ncbi:hypothetical protein GX441_00365 [bacterium]|nr:hypothetical protein [bacterium]
MNKGDLQAKLNQDYEELINNVEFHVEGLKFDFAEEVSKYLGNEEGKVTRAELARRMESTPAWITKMLRTNWNMTMETMAKIAFALGMKVETKLVRINDVSSRLVYHEKDNWAKIPVESSHKKPPVIPREKPLEAIFQPLVGEVDFENMPNYEEALVA